MRGTALTHWETRLTGWSSKEEDVELMRFEVTVSSHDLLRQGVCEAESRFVAVMAEDYGDGQVMAAQMVYAREAMAGTKFDMVTGCYPYI